MPAFGASRLNGPAPAATAGTGIHIQVGAFNSKAEADRRLAEVQAQAGTLLANYPIASTQAVANGKTVFRARFTSVDPASAGNVCNELRRRNIDCMVAKPE
jgi:D-alanyl-D-alanine carboxypeptidase